MTCVGGNVDARQVERNTRAVLELAGRTDRRGGARATSGRSSGRSRRRPRRTGRRASATPSCRRRRRPLSDRHAVDVSSSTRARRPGEVTLVTLRPADEPRPARSSASRSCRACSGGWVLMGGAYRVPGNTAPTTEWNIHCDPEAAKIAFDAWAVGRRRPLAPVALGLDVTEKAKILPDHIVALARRAGSTPDDSIALARGEDPMHATRSVASNPIVRFIADALRFYMEFHTRYDGFYGAFIHDPLAVAAALDPSLVRTEAARRRRGAGRDADGRRDRDRLARVWGRPPNVDVAVEADAAEFLAGSWSASAGWRRVARRGKLSRRRAGPGRGGRGPSRTGGSHACLRLDPRDRRDRRVLRRARRSASIVAGPLDTDAPTRTPASRSGSTRSSLVARRRPCSSAWSPTPAIEYAQTGRLDSIASQFDTRTIVLIPIAIAINIILGQTVAAALKVPIYLDSIGTILVGVLAGPIAGRADRRPGQPASGPTSCRRRSTPTTPRRSSSSRSRSGCSPASSAGSASSGAARTRRRVSSRSGRPSSS